MCPPPAEASASNARDGTRHARNSPSTRSLEGIRPGAQLAAAVVKDLQPSRAGAAHELPVFEIIGGQIACGFVVAGVIRQYLVTKVEAEDGRQQLAVRVGDGQHLAVFAELLLQRFKVTLRQCRCAVAVHVVGVQAEEAVHAAIHFALQAVLDALAHHRALLARDGQHVGFFVGQDGLAEGDVHLLPWPIFMAALQLAQFQVIDTQALRQAFCLRFQQLRAGLIFSRHAAIDGEGQARQRLAEEHALDMRQRQHAGDAALLLRVQEVGLMSKHLQHDVLPAGAVEEGGLRACQHKGVPQRSAADVSGRKTFDGGHGSQLGALAPGRKIWSMRPQRKSCIRLCRRPSVRAMLT